MYRLQDGTAVSPSCASSDNTTTATSARQLESSLLKESRSNTIANAPPSIYSPVSNEQPADRTRALSFCGGYFGAISS